MKITLALLLILAMCGGLLFSCGADAPFPLYTYENAAQYTAGPVSLDADIQRLDIDWRSGSITVGYHDEDHISVTEENAPTLGSSSALHYRLDGDTLRIRFAKSGHLGTTSLRDKDLTLLLPRDAVLRNLSIETVSADISVQNITADDFDLESVSGKLELLDVHFSDEMEAETVSGDVELHLADDGFSARISTFTGTVHSDFPYSKVDNAYICGSGGPELDVETLSGNVEIFSLK